MSDDEKEFQEIEHALAQKLHQAAKGGPKIFRVMKLRREHHDVPMFLPLDTIFASMHEVQWSRWLRGAAKMVYDLLKVKGLLVTIETEYCRDPEQGKTWENFYLLAYGG
jgi:hypothetical protein